MTLQDKHRVEWIWKQIIHTIGDGGTYFYEKENQTYQILDGKMYGNQEAIEVIKKETTEDFHKNLVVSEL